jgi:hypothetical protein
LGNGNQELIDNLPNPTTILKLSKITDIIWISDLGGVAPARDSVDLYRLALSTMG